eukprot:3014224-Amphidinium_carterae.1
MTKPHKGKGTKGKRTDMASMVEMFDIQHRPAYGYNVTAKGQYQSDKTTVLSISSEHTNTINVSTKT